MKPLQWAIIGLWTYTAIRCLDVLPRERAIKNTMCAQGKIYGRDWQWKQPADARELLFGLQEVEYLR